MKHSFIFFTLLACCTATKTEEGQSFKLVNSKTETVGLNVDKMDLYVPTDVLDVSMLVKLCAEKKKDWKDGAFYYLVVFDSSKYASFPNNPFTSLYGIDEEPQKHILAVYEYNRLNKFSRLNYYDKNMWEGQADIRAID